MEKTFSYHKSKKIINFYLIIATFVCILVLSQLFKQIDSKQMDYFFQDTFKKIGIESFVTAFFSISPNLAYISTTENNNTMDDVNSALFLAHTFFPILGYLINSEIVSDYPLSEIYPFLSPKQKDENDLEVFAQDENFYEPQITTTTSTKITQILPYTLEQLSNYNFVINNFYTVDGTTQVTSKDFDLPYFLDTDMSIDSNIEGPKILIYHTHSQESFIDSEKGEASDTIVGVGDELAKLLNEEYGIEVIHHRDSYDIIDGVLERNKAYELIEKSLEEIIAENPTIEILIDLHRDGIPDNKKLVTEIDGKPTAKIMFFNGISRKFLNGELTALTSMPNPYIKDNMAFSFQMHLKANELYPGLTRKIYIKGYRYNLHLMPKSLLIEVGAQTNSVEEVKNAMEPLAEILYEVIK